MIEKLTRGGLVFNLTNLECASAMPLRAGFLPVGTDVALDPSMFLRESDVSSILAGSNLPAKVLLSPDEIDFVPDLPGRFSSTSYCGIAEGHAHQQSIFTATRSTIN